MLYIVLIFTAVITGGYFSFRYFSILYAFKHVIKEITNIQQDFTKNQVLHLPIPDRHLGKLLSAFNTTLEEIRKERQKYEKREKDFERQIENISHDLRTPLTVILGYLKLIKKSWNNSIKDENERSETIDIIEDKAESLKNLVIQFYDFTRVNAGDYKLPLNKVDITKTIRESIIGLYRILERTHLQVEVDIPDYPIWVLGEESALERIFHNLFQNAGRYAYTYLHILMKNSKQGISISFINDTKVLTENDIPHLFERFYMQDQSRSQGGSGLGLTVAKSLAESMGAELNAHALSRESIGSELNVPEICFELFMKPFDR
ncbi:two-component sensor histidine kinase [Anaerocolumna cellulosilytica]|uniref:histidine kinase n=1 Tax=Anaerocolumna cellulosilytica TaxID=433286 RepID=A0A6S6R879_9FIRM|nr:HAMP domain-containing sensor histidine kinase [Anaerocolumna cellulosilytica]BCJ95542.1 two-component sensor histidine kinase [Anaerocolumna cellulosilytica]